MTQHTHESWNEEADCPMCRAVLLEAFREPPMPHLIVPEDRARTVQMPAPGWELPNPELAGRCPHCGTGQRDIVSHMGLIHPREYDEWIRARQAVWPRRPVHTVEAIVQSEPNRPGGTWAVSCTTCGWKLHGHWSENSAVARLRSLRLAEDKGQQHVDNPLADIGGGCGS